MERPVSCEIAIRFVISLWRTWKAFSSLANLYVQYTEHFHALAFVSISRFLIRVVLPLCTHTHTICMCFHVVHYTTTYITRGRGTSRRYSKYPGTGAVAVGRSNMPSFADGFLRPPHIRWTCAQMYEIGPHHTSISRLVTKYGNTEREQARRLAVDIAFAMLAIRQQ